MKRSLRTEFGQFHDAAWKMPVTMATSPLAFCGLFDVSCRDQFLGMLLLQHQSVSILHDISGVE